MKKNGKSRKPLNGRKLTEHHILPTSRGGNGNDGNVIKIPLHFHGAWHQVFGNMTIEESMEFIEIVFLGKGQKKKRKTWRTEELYELQIDLQKRTFNAGRQEKLSRNPKWK